VAGVEDVNLRAWHFAAVGFRLGRLERRVVPSPHDGESRLRRLRPRLPLRIRRDVGAVVVEQLGLDVRLSNWARQVMASSALPVLLTLVGCRQTRRLLPEASRRAARVRASRSPESSLSLCALCSSLSIYVRHGSPGSVLEERGADGAAQSAPRLGCRFRVGMSELSAWLRCPLRHDNACPSTESLCE